LALVSAIRETVSHNLAHLLVCACLAYACAYVCVILVSCSPPHTHTLPAFPMHCRATPLALACPQVAIRTTHWTVVNHALIWGTLALWLPFLGLLTGLCGSVSGMWSRVRTRAHAVGWFPCLLRAPAAAPHHTVAGSRSPFKQHQQQPRLTAGHARCSHRQSGGGRRVRFYRPCVR
jgi:hypothetical protein